MYLCQCVYVCLSLSLSLVSSWCKRAHRFQSQGLHFTTRSAGSSIRADRPLSCSFLQMCFTSCSLLHHFLGQVLFSRVRAKTCVIPPDMSRALRPKTVQNLQWKNCRQGPFSKKNRWRRHRRHVLKPPHPSGTTEQQHGATDFIPKFSCSPQGRPAVRPDSDRTLALPL